MIRLNLDDLIYFNKYICKISGEVFNILDTHKLESALSAYDSYYNTKEQVAAAIYRNLIIAHGFENGNKRVAVIALYAINKPKCSDLTLRNLTLRVASGGGSKISVDYIVSILYGDKL